MAEVMKKRKQKTKNNHTPAMSGLLDVISPSGIDFKPKHIMIGEAYARVLVVNAYPTELGPGWLSRISSMPGVAVSLHAVPTDAYNLIDEIKVSMGEAESRTDSGNHVTRRRAEKQFKDNELMLKKIDEDQQKVFNVVVVIMVTASDEDVLNMRTRNVEQRLAGMGMRGRAPLNKQEEAFISVGPWAILHPDTYKFGWRNMPAESVAGAYPFIYSGLNDEDGVLLGKDDTGGIVLIDIWKRFADRTNSNLTILGRPGVGKSTTIKKWLKEEFGRGCKLIILDPEDEYSDLAKGCDGAVIDAGNGSFSRVNPLQVRGHVPLDIDLEDGEKPLYSPEEVEQGLVAMHFNFLRTFFKLYLREGRDDRDFTKMHLSCLEMALIETYSKFGINWEADPTTIPNDKWPHVGHLYETIQEKAKEEKYREYWEDLELLLYPAALGADKHLWCGPTTLQPKDEVVVLNLQRILEADEQLKRAQFFNILSWAWDEIDADWGERIILAVDEAYLLADPETPQALQFLRNTSKRIRKREGGLWVITHNMIDFMDPAIRRYGQALLDNPSYKFIMGQGENDIEALSKLMSLSDKEVQTIAEAKRGQGLLIAGSKRLSIKVQITKEDELFIGSAGGR